MLKHLTVRNLAVTREADVTFGPGMNVFTGETGAGKSVLVSAIALVLGARAASDAVRAGADRALVAAEFDLACAPEAAAALDAQGIEHDGVCLIRRQVNADGGSRAYLNDTPVTLKALGAVTSRLVAIHGQHQHYELAGRDAQRGLLDAFGLHEDKAAAVAAAHLDWRQAADALSTLEQAGVGADREAFLKFQIDELAEIALTPEAFAELDSRHRQLAHASELAAGVETALTALEEQDGIDAALSTLAPLERFAPQLGEVRSLLGDAEAIVQEARSALRRVIDDTDATPETLSELDRQLTAIHTAARKFKVAPEALGEHLTMLREELDALTNREAELARAADAVAAAERRWSEQAAALTRARRAASKRLGPEVTRLIADLGMPDGRLEATLTPREGGVHPHGAEDVEFLVTTNAGQPPRPLGRVASGGELSRIALAIQTATASLKGVPVLIYDEVDTGISGRVAELVGRRLRETAAHRQVICVTHLPQVASLSQHHFSVRKAAKKQTTEVSVAALAGEDRVEELARMLAGVEVSETSRSHAREMLARSTEAS